MRRFVINLLGTNLAACCLFLPLAAVDNVLERPGAVLCSVGRAAAAGTCAASVLAVLLIAIDQYCAVVDPLRYHSRISRLRSAGKIQHERTSSTFCVPKIVDVKGILSPLPMNYSAKFSKRFQVVCVGDPTFCDIMPTADTFFSAFGKFQKREGIRFSPTQHNSFSFI